VVDVVDVMTMRPAFCSALLDDPVNAVVLA